MQPQISFDPRWRWSALAIAILFRAPRWGRSRSPAATGWGCLTAKLLLRCPGHAPPARKGSCLGEQARSGFWRSGAIRLSHIPKLWCLPPASWRRTRRAEDSGAQRYIRARSPAASAM